MVSLFILSLINIFFVFIDKKNDESLSMDCLVFILEETKIIYSGLDNLGHLQVPNTDQLILLTTYYELTS